MAPIWLAMLAEKLVNSRNAAAAQGQKQSEIAANYAAGLGAPTYGVQAAGANKAISEAPGAGFVQRLLARQQEEEEKQKQLGVR